MTTLTYTGSLTVVVCWCGMRHAVPTELRRQQLESHNLGEKLSVYCPLGHTHVPCSEPETKKLKRQLAAERARHDQTRAELEHTERRRRAAVGQNTKMRKRVGRGVCPCCNRHFENLARHMQTKHPEFCEGEVE